MPLKLATGPVNSGKADLVLEAVGEAAAAGSDPVLVVPTSADSDLLRRDLARRGVTAAVRVTGFSGLWEQIARRLEFDPRPLSSFRLQRVARTVTDEALVAGDLQVLASSASGDGFASALVSLAEELGAVRASAEKFDRVMAAWGDATPSRAEYAREVAILYRRYRERLLQIGCRDNSSYVVELLGRLESDPARWLSSPVFCYGFDDFGLTQLDTIRALSELADAPVTISFPFEQRVAFDGRTSINQQLLELAGDGVIVQPVSGAHYLPESAETLAGFERGLFELEAAAVAPGDAVEAIVGGGERAEMELVAARAAALIGAGLRPEQIAVAIRDLDDAAPLIEEVFAANGVPIAMRLRVTIGDTVLVGGILALLTCALCEPPDDDQSGRLARSFLTWLRTPGAVGSGYLDRVNRLEQMVLIGQIQSLSEAEACWLELTGFDRNIALDNLRGGFAEGQQQGYRRAAEQARRVLASASGAGEAPILGRQQLRSAEALGDLIVGLDDLDWLVEKDPALAPSSADLIRELAARQIEVGESLVVGAVSVALPLSLRARRVDSLIVARMQESQYPKRRREDPFLDDQSRISADRAAVAAGLNPIWPAEPTDRLADERHLLHALLSRAEGRLIYSHHRRSDRGELANPTLFLDDIEQLLDPPPAPITRLLGAIAWEPISGEPRLAPSDYQRHLGAIAPEDQLQPQYDVTEPHALAALAGREVWSTTAIELYLRCPMSWLIERFLRPERLEPERGHLAYGTSVHTALEQLFKRLPPERRLISAENLPLALELLAGVVAVIEPSSTDPVLDQIRRRQIFRAVSSYLEHAAGSGTQFVPDEFELRFGFDGDPPADLGDGLVLKGQVDRVDRLGDQAIIIDYKSGSATNNWGAKKSVREGLLQNALYSLVVEQQRSGVEVVGGLYQAVRATDALKGRPRGAISAEADDQRSDIVGGDRIDADAFRELLADARQAAIDAIAAIEQGKLEPTTPEGCAFSSNKGCAYPGICRRLL